MPASRQPPNPNIYQLKVTLRDTHPPIWRRIQVPGNTTLYKLHQILQIVMGWTNSHLHQFEVGDVHYSEPSADWEFDMKNSRRARLRDVATAEKAKLLYEYDFGDSWLHEILVEKILPPATEKRYPVCNAGERACPPEDVGGVWGYEEFLEAIRNPVHGEHESMLEWIGGSFNPEAFDLQEVNQQLSWVR